MILSWLALINLPLANELPYVYIRRFLYGASVRQQRRMAKWSLQRAAQKHQAWIAQHREKEMLAYPASFYSCFCDGVQLFVPAAAPAGTTVIEGNPTSSGLGNFLV